MSKVATSLRVFLTGCLLSMTGSLPARAQSENPEHRPDRSSGEVLAALPVIEAGPASDSTASASELEGLQSIAGRVAFQSFRDGNWEIYYGDDVLAGVRRLTADGAADVEPALSRDSQRIAFTSKRTGNYDIFAMNTDGGGLVRLTSDGAVDSAPAWSPNGQRILFQSNRSGNVDVWVMNADGSGQTRLTTNADYDGEATWSPDGTQIAFVSRRSGDTAAYNLYLMDADGGNQRVIATPPYSSRPAWSADGTTILFDSANPDGWQRATIYDVTQASYRVETRYDGSVDYEMDSWAIGDTYYMTRVEYIYQNNTWYINTLVPHFFQLSNSQVNTVFGGPYDASISWSSLDRTPPHTLGATAWSTLQPQQRHTFFAFAEDAGGRAAIYQAQRRAVPGGSWGPTTGGCNTYPGSGGICTDWNVDSVMEYRIRAIDLMGNVEPWSDNPSDWVRIFSYVSRARGTITDARGRGLGGVTVQSAESVEGQVVTGDGGQYELHIAADAPYTVTASLAGDTATRSSAGLVPVDGVLTIDFVLTGAGNVVTNGGFETGVDAWTATGQYHVAETGIQSVEGSHAFILGDAFSSVFGSTGFGSAASELEGTAAASLATITQTVTLPSVAVEPSLSFIYRIAGLNGSNPLIIRVLDASGASVLAEEQFPMVWSWTYASMDLSAWAGQTVILMFDVEQVPVVGFPVPQSFFALDDIFVGPAAHPSITGLTPASVPGPTGTISVTGSHFTQQTVVTIGGQSAAATFVDANTLTVVVPTGLSWGRQAVWATDSGGFGEEASPPLIVGYSLPLPVLFRAAPGDTWQIAP